MFFASAPIFASLWIWLFSFEFSIQWGTFSAFVLIKDQHLQTLHVYTWNTAKQLVETRNSYSQHLNKAPIEVSGSFA